MLGGRLESQQILSGRIVVHSAESPVIITGTGTHRQEATINGVCARRLTYCGGYEKLAPLPTLCVLPAGLPWVRGGRPLPNGVYR
jgi:hypothetical protein